METFYKYKSVAKMTESYKNKSAEQQPLVLPPIPSLPSSRRKPPRTKATSRLLLLSSFLLLPSHCHCFLPSTSIQKKQSLPLVSSSITRIPMVYKYDLRDPDMMEIFMGGERYENVLLPDSMLDTTIFVGNLCEFAQDEDLSQKFRSVTNLKSLPACVARRPNSQSLEYGFVAFPTVEEKEAAIIRFHGAEFMGRRLKVEEIIDHPRKGRVHVPEKLVTYVLGVAKKTPRGKNDFSLRKTSNTSNSKRRQGDNESYASNENSDRQNNINHTQGRRKGDRKQKRANHKRRRRKNRDQDYFY